MITVSAQRWISGLLKKKKNSVFFLLLRLWELNARLLMSYANGEANPQLRTTLQTCTNVLFWFSVKFTILGAYRINVRGTFISKGLKCA